MKSFSPAGMANKGLFGLGARTYGNPGGALSGNGSFNGGGGPPPPPAGLNFTYRGNITGEATFCMQTDGAGTTLMVTKTGKVWQSTDGGHTWAQIFTITGGFGPLQNIGQMAFAANTWIISEDGFTDRSQNVSVVWSRTANGIQNAGGVIFGTNGTGHWVGVGNIHPASPGSTLIYGNSVDNAITWNTGGNVTPIYGNAFPARILFDGTQYIFGAQGQPSNAGQLLTSTDMVNWTLSPMTDPTLAWAGVFLIGGIYYGTSGFTSNTIGIGGATVAGLLTPSQQIPLNQNPFGLLHAAGQWVAYSFNLSVSSAPAVTGPWTDGQLNIPAPNNFIVNLVFDPVHNSFICVGDQGGVSTVP